MRDARLAVVLGLGGALCGSAALAHEPASPPASHQEIAVNDPATAPAAGPKRARTPDDYLRRSLRSLASAPARSTSAQASVAGSGNEMLDGDILPSRVEAVFTPGRRELPADKAALLERWAQRYAGSVEHYTAGYVTEMRFDDAGAGHWLAIRRDLLPRLEATLSPGETVDLHVVRIAASPGGGAEPLILVEDLRDPESLDPAAEGATPPAPPSGWSSRLGQDITVEGVARNAKLGALLVAGDSSLWIDGLDEWPQHPSAAGVAGMRVRVRGTLAEREDLPVFATGDGGEVRAGVPVPAGADPQAAARRFLLADARWRVQD